MLKSFLELLLIYDFVVKNYISKMTSDMIYDEEFMKYGLKEILNLTSEEYDSLTYKKINEDINYNLVKEKLLNSVSKTPVEIYWIVKDTYESYLLNL